MNIKTGITLITGVPGSGKSFTCVESVLDTVRKARRPVYTNLPLRWRVIKLWLKMKEGDDIAGLIRPITETTFNRFINRFQARQQFLDERRHLGRRQALNQWYETHGPDINEGMDLNWIPAGALIAIDEAHHWYPNPALSNVRKREPEALMSYLTMHRHLLHCVTFITQADRQVSSTVKSLMNTQIQVTRLDADLPMIGLQLSQFGFVAFRVKEWDGVADPEQEPPLRESLTIPSIPCNSYKFRLYSSFTHMGSLRELKKELAQLKEDSIVKLDTIEEEAPTMSFRKKFLLLTTLTLGSCIFGMMWSSLSTEDPPPPVSESLSAEADDKPAFTLLGWRDNLPIVRYQDKTVTLNVGFLLGSYEYQASNRKNKALLFKKGETVYVYQNNSWLKLGNSFDVVDSLVRNLDSVQPDVEAGSSSGIANSSNE